MLSSFLHQHLKGNVLGERQELSPATLPVSSPVLATTAWRAVRVDESHRYSESSLLVLRRNSLVFLALYRIRRGFLPYPEAALPESTAYPAWTLRTRSLSLLASVAESDRRIASKSERPNSGYLGVFSSHSNLVLAIFWNRHSQAVIVQGIVLL